jgi:hypothetical protein
MVIYPEYGSDITGLSREGYSNLDVHEKTYRSWHIPPFLKKYPLGYIHTHPWRYPRRVLNCVSRHPGISLLSVIRSIRASSFGHIVTTYELMYLQLCYPKYPRMHVCSIYTYLQLYEMYVDVCLCMLISAFSDLQGPHAWLQPRCCSHHLQGRCDDLCLQRNLLMHRFNARLYNLCSTLSSKHTTLAGFTHQSIVSLFEVRIHRRLQHNGEKEGRHHCQWCRWCPEAQAASPVCRDR